MIVGLGVIRVAVGQRVFVGVGVTEGVGLLGYGVGVLVCVGQEVGLGVGV